MAQDWDIKPPKDSCTGCSTAFTDGQNYRSTLAFVGQEGYTRADFCETCWSAGTARPATPYSIWNGVYRVPAPKPEEALKKETAESLLRRLMETEDPTQRNVIYILAVMLERKRILVERDVQTREDGTRIRMYEHRKTSETFLVPDPQLRLDQLEPVQQEVVAMLGGTNPAAPAPAAVPESPAPQETPAPA